MAYLYNYFLNTLRIHSAISATVIKTIHFTCKSPFGHVENLIVYLIKSSHKLNNYSFIRYNDCGQDFTLSTIFRRHHQNNPNSSLSSSNIVLNSKDNINSILLILASLLGVNSLFFFNDSGIFKCNTDEKFTLWFNS